MKSAEKDFSAQHNLKSFTAKILIINGNPYVRPPDRVLRYVFKQAGRDTGPIPVRGTLQGASFHQTLVKYAGDWRLYSNHAMLKAGGVWIGDSAKFKVGFNPKPPTFPMPRKFALALSRNPKAKTAYVKLSPGRQKEIRRYLGFMKTDESLTRNIGVVIQHLLGKKPKTQYALMHRPEGYRKNLTPRVKRQAR